MTSAGSVGLLLVLITVLVSYRAFRSEALQANYLFSVAGILRFREYSRLVTSGFVHAGWVHLGVNMYTLLSFAGRLEQVAGPWQLLLIYGVSLVGGNLLSLYINRNNESYQAVGASGAVAGVIFALIVLFPSMSISPLFLPFRLPAWLVGLAYTLYSIYGIKARRDGIGHEAHLGGALAGMVVILLLFPDVLPLNWPFVVLLTVPTLGFLFFLVNRPEWLYLDGFSLQKVGHDTIDHRFNAQKISRQQEIDRILDKINQQGINSLTQQERTLLAEQ